MYEARNIRTFTLSGSTPGVLVTLFMRFESRWNRSRQALDR
jgi:hypothetical protein